MSDHETNQEDLPDQDQPDQDPSQADEQEQSLMDHLIELRDRLLHNQEVQINELQQQIKTSVDTVGAEIKKDMPSSDFLTDTLEDSASHTFQDEVVGDQAQPSTDKSASADDKK